MGSVINQSKSSTIFLYIGALIGYVNLFLIFPKVLSPGEIGAYRLLIDSAWIILPFIQFGLPSIAARFHAHNLDNDNQKLYFTYFLLSSNLILLGLFWLVYLPLHKEFEALFGFDGEEFNGISYLAIPITVSFLSLSNILGTILRNWRKNSVFFFSNEIIIRCVPLIAALLLWIGYIDIKLFLYAIPLAFFAQFLLLGFSYWKSSPKSDGSEKFVFKAYLNRETVTYGAFMLLGLGTTYLVQKVDTVMTASLLSLDLAGIYSIAFFMGNVIEFPRRAVNSVLYPYISEALKAENHTKLKEIYTKSSINQLLLGGVIFSLIALNLPFIYQLIPNGELYEAGFWVAIIIGASKLFDMLWGVNSEILLLSKYYKNNIWIMVAVGICTVGLNLLLIPIYGINGTALATLLTVILHNLLRGYMVYRKLSVLPFSRQHFRVLACFILPLVVLLLFPSFDFGIIVSVLILSSLYLIIFTVLFLLLNPSQELKDELFKLLKIKK